MNKLSHFQRHMLLKHAGVGRPFVKWLRHKGMLPKTEMGNNVNMVKTMRDAQGASPKARASTKDHLGREKFKSPAAGSPGEAITHEQPLRWGAPLQK